MSETFAGVVPDLDEQTYHAHPALSVSGAKKLLPPSCPAIFRYEQLNPPEPKAVFDIGSAAHALVLGVGAELATIDADDWRSKAAQAARDEARTAGKIPLLRKDSDAVHAMAEALQGHPLAASLLRDGTPELSLFWSDPDTGTDLRGRVDYFTGDTIVDYKSCASAEPSTFAKAVANYGYHMQAAFYTDGVKAVGLHDQPRFLFVCQEKTAPYLVTVIELDTLAIHRGRERNRLAIDTYVGCVMFDEWPGYTDDVTVVGLPGWAA